MRLPAFECHRLLWSRRACVRVSARDAESRLDLATGKRTLLTERKGYGRPSPDGTRLLLSTEDGLFIMDLASGEEQLLRSLEDGVYPTTVAWSPDDAHVASVFVKGEQQEPWLERIDVATGERTVLYENKLFVVFDCWDFSTKIQLGFREKTILSLAQQENSEPAA